MLVIHCPACDAGLRLPRSVLARRARRICCAVCEHRWMQAPIVEIDPPVEEASTAPEISLMAESGRIAPPEAPVEEAAPSLQAQQRRRISTQAIASLAAKAGLGLLRLSLRILSRLMPQRLPHRVAAGVGVFLVMFAVMKREAIVRAAPPLAGAYAAIGLPINLQGLQWRDVKTRVVVEAAQRVLAVEGEIRNLRDYAQNVPDIQLSLRDDDGREVYRWSTPAPKANLGQNETIQFRARLASPPDSAKALRVHFAEAAPAPGER